MYNGCHTELYKKIYFMSRIGILHKKKKHIIEGEISSTSPLIRAGNLCPVEDSEVIIENVVFHN